MLAEENVFPRMVQKILIATYKIPLIVVIYITFLHQVLKFWRHRIIKDLFYFYLHIQLLHKYTDYTGYLNFLQDLFPDWNYFVLATLISRIV